MSPTATEKTIYLVRHGQSEGNVSPVFQSTDSPLTERGRQQAQLIAGRIAKLSFDALIASPLPRTKETAAAITQATGKIAEYSSLFVERIKPSELNGKPYADEEANKLWKLWEQSLSTLGLKADDGENFEELLARADQALDFLQHRPESALVVVTHGYFLRTLVIRAILSEGLTQEAFKNFQTRVAVENTGLTVLKHTTDYEGTGWRLIVYNDHAHLG